MPPMSSRRPRTFPVGLVAVGALGVVVLGGFLAVRARSQEPSADPSTAAAPSGVAALEALLESPAGSAASGESDPSKVHILSKTSLTDAIAVARPMMSNTVGRLDVGSALLAMWSSKNLSWRALEALPETSPALFKKDPDAERGGRLCVSGTVLEIRAEKTLSNRLLENRALPLIDRAAPAQPQQPSDSTRPLGVASAGGLLPTADPLQYQGVDFTIPDGGKVYIATIQAKSDAASEAARGKARDSLFVEIIAVKSSGTLVDGSDARACGVLTGVTVPPAGGSAALGSSPVHRVVGMFDLPPNRATGGVEITAQHG
jgi:hypothetical protein